MQWSSPRNNRWRSQLCDEKVARVLGRIWYLAFWTIGINCKVKLSKLWAKRRPWHIFWYLVLGKYCNCWSKFITIKMWTGKSYRGKSSHRYDDWLYGGETCSFENSIVNHFLANNGSMDFHLIDQIYPDINQAFPSISNS